MAKKKEKEGVMFPSLMSMLGIGGSTKGLVGDVTGTSGMGGVVGSLYNMGKKKKEGEDAEIQRFSDPKALQKQREQVRKSYMPSSRSGLMIAGFPLSLIHI